MDPVLRGAVFSRDRHCVKCGKPLREPVAVHHRKLRKHGGQDDITNLIALCSPCHNIAPGSVHQNPRISYENGWLVHSWDNPEECPVTLANGSRVLLTGEGTYMTVEESNNGW
jgi:hypothetical protein